VSSRFLYTLRWKWRSFWYWPNIDHTYARRRRFSHLTGLHGTYVHNRGWLPDDEIIALQARKIAGLTLQLNQQRKGYLRKIARLERNRP
jgi:hypothetical protein